MKTSTIQPRKPRWILLSILFWLGIWQLAALVMNQPLLLASPADTLARFAVLCTTVPFWQAVAGSLLRVLLGMVLGVLAGCLLAALCYGRPRLTLLFSPLMAAVKATPVASFVILALLWFRTAQVPVFSSFLMVFPLVYANLAQGLSEIDPQLLEMARSYRFTKRQTFTLVTLPSILPYFRAACATAIGFCWKASVAAEVIARPKGSLGTALYNSKVYLETTDLFVWTMTVILLSIALEWGLKRLLRNERRKGA